MAAMITVAPSETMKVGAAASQNIFLDYRLSVISRRGLQQPESLLPMHGQ